MERIVIEGGRPLCGTVRVSGAKNAALPIMAAAALTRGTSVLHEVPRLVDVETMRTILRALGVESEWTGSNSLSLTPTDCTACEPPPDLVRRMRGSVCVLGPLLARRGAAALALPGGCVLGSRPIDLHLKGLRALGAEFLVEEKRVRGRTGRTARSERSRRADRLRGARVDMEGPHGSTVLGTANVMAAATLAEGRTVIINAACEPELHDLADYLCACGARISGAGSPVVTIEGVRGLRGAEHTLIPDRIEAGTFLAAAAMAGGEVRLANVRPEHMAAVLQLVQRIGVQLDWQDGVLRVRRPGRAQPAHVVAEPYPGFPTDMQPQLASLLCLADGTSSITDRVYPQRFTHMEDLRRMGARLAAAPHGLAIEGVASLRGASVHAADLRAGAALVASALAAEGVTTLTGVEQIDRGYQDLVPRLQALGAIARREQAEQDAAALRRSA
jgi:UDP-N-acetylglucosamine 1-carboxyvinyltransferase